MRTPRFTLSADAVAELESAVPSCRLGVEESHHLKNVLRLRPGSEVEIIDGRKRYRGRYVRDDGERAFCEIDGVEESPLLPPVHLLVGLPSPSVCDIVVEKSVELAATSVQLFIAARSQGRERGERRMERLERIAAAAVKQSGAPEIPAIRLHSSLADLFRELHASEKQAGEWRVVCSAPQGASEPRPPGLNELEPPQAGGATYLLIGPEGGFTEEEHALANKWQYLPISLGPCTLRTETAVIAACALVRLLRPAG